MPAISSAGLALLGLGCVVAASSSLAGHRPSEAPVISVKNGSYYGVHSTTFDQDLFLGIPFAELPLNNLRFANPKPYDRKWHGVLPATSYAFVGSKA